MEFKDILIFKNQDHYTSGKKKKKLTLTVDEELTKLAMSAEINLSATLENLLRLLIEGR